MFITKMSLPRRTFLRGLGATVALPLLDAMVPALSAMTNTAAKPFTRVGFIYVPMGASPPYWTPKGEGTNFEFSPSLTPLAPYRDKLLVLSGLDHTQANSMGDGDGDHTRGSAAWLTGVHIRKSEKDILNGPSADQIAAQQLGKQTQLESLLVTAEPAGFGAYCSAGYSCTYMNTFSWRAANMPLPMEGNPRIVFEQLFGEGGNAADKRAQLQDDRSILDSLTKELDHLQSTLGAGDRRKVSEYLDAVRDIEHRIRLVEEKKTENAVSTPAIPLGTPDDYEEYVKLMFDLQVLAYQGDITRVAAFQMGREENLRTYPNIGVVEPHHPLSHHQGNPSKLANLAKVNNYHCQLLTYYLEKLRNTPDGDGNLLDHSMTLYGSGLGDPMPHDHNNLPALLLGGGAGTLKGGRHIKYAAGTSMSNLLVTMLDKAGVHVDKIGDSSGKVDLDSTLSTL